MGIISRGIKNAFRNGIRTISIIFILAVSVSMALIMLMALKTVQGKIDNVKSSIGNIITVSPAGVRGFEGGGDLLSEQNAADISALPYVQKVTKVLSDRVTPGTDTSLTSAIDAGSFGNRMRQRNGDTADSSGNSRNAPARTFTMPINAAATSDLGVVSSLGVGQLNVTSGALFDAASQDNVALLGADLATKNNLSVGSTFQTYGADIKVAGIFDTGNKFTNAMLVMPINTLQKLSSQTDQLNSIIVQTDSIDSITGVQSAIKDKLGADKVDVVSQQDNSENAIKPLENIKTVSLYSLVGSLVAGAVIILLTMIMIVRERRREIGVLKAIGSSNAGIMGQFTVEALVLTLTSSVLGMIFGLIFSNPILKVLVANSGTEASGNVREAAGQFARGGGAGRMVQAIGGGAAVARDSLSNLHAVIGWEIILYGLAAAVIIAIIGSAIPAFFIAKIRPAEVMRAE